MASLKFFDKGLVQVFTGEGRGKTSAAIGTVVRALGNGLKVRIIAFMKAGHPSGEWEILSRLENVNISRFGAKGFVNPDKPMQEDREQAAMALKEARESVMSGNYNVVLLDEVNVAAAWNLIDVHDVLSLIKAKPENVELILTGRGADKEIVKAADLVTEMLNIKHPYENGTVARKGIEY